MVTNPKQTEIWQVDLNPIKGAEKGKKRPVVVVSNGLIERSHIRVIVPVTGRKPEHNDYYWMIKIDPDSTNHLAKVSTIDCLHIRSIDKSRFIKKIGKINQATLNDIKSMIGFIID